MQNTAIKNTVMIAFVALLATSAYVLSSANGQYLKGIIAGAGPLTLYFLIVLSTIKRLPKTQIDTVYYFGFLITIMSLGFSAFEFKTDGEIDIGNITKQFAIGLIATGLALVYRLILMSINDKDVEDYTREIKEHSEALAILRGEITSMFVAFETCSRTFSEVSNKGLESTVSTHEKTSRQLEEIHSKSLEVITSSLERAMGSAMEDLKVSSSEAASTIQLFNTNVGAIAKSTELKNINKSLNTLSSTFENFNETIHSSNTKISSSSNVVNLEQMKLVEVVSSSKDASLALIELRKQLENEKAIAISAQLQFSKSMEDLTSSIKTLIQKIEVKEEALNVSKK